MAMARAPRSTCCHLQQQPRAPPGWHTPFTTRLRRARCSAAAAASATPSVEKLLWVQTANQAVLTAAVEAGHTTAVLPAGAVEQAAAWMRVVKFHPLFQEPGGVLQDADGAQVGRMVQVGSREDLQAAEAAASSSGYVVMDASDWKVIPAENLVATFQSSPGRLLGVACSAAEGRVLLEALEAGTAGVVLRTEDPLQVKELAAYLQERSAANRERVTYTPATVTRVEPVGMGDRVCVDLCSMLAPGEGMLVGSFSRGLFLVHSECMESAYINSRPFRVNAGAVHAYLQAPGSRTSYLSELSSGSRVLVADAAGRTRSEVVGRIKLEARPLMLVEACTLDGVLHSTLLQNAETVRLVGPAQQQQQQQQKKKEERPMKPSEDVLLRSEAAGGASSTDWVALPVSELAPGDVVYVLQQEGARHTGISIQERIVER